MNNTYIKKIQFGNQKRIENSNLSLNFTIIIFLFHLNINSYSEICVASKIELFTNDLIEMI